MGVGFWDNTLFYKDGSCWFYPFVPNSRLWNIIIISEYIYSLNCHKKLLPNFLLLIGKSASFVLQILMECILDKGLNFDKISCLADMRDNNALEKVHSNHLWLVFPLNRGKKFHWLLYRLLSVTEGRVSADSLGWLCTKKEIFYDIKTSTKINVIISSKVPNAIKRFFFVNWMIYFKWHIQISIVNPAKVFF